MSEIIELDPVDTIGAGAIGEPGARRFLIQAVKGGEVVSVLVEKEQVALLSTEVVQFLDRLAEQYPEDRPIADAAPPASVRDVEPLFRARLIGLGFDPDREMVLIELREHAPDDDDEDDDDEDDDELEGFVARLYATRAQVRAMAAGGAASVTAGRPTCPLCEQPMGPGRHICPRWN